MKRKKMDSGPIDYIVDDEVIPACCNTMSIELIEIEGILKHVCSNCDSMRPELD